MPSLIVDFSLCLKTQANCLNNRYIKKKIYIYKELILLKVGLANSPLLWQNTRCVGVKAGTPLASRCVFGVNSADLKGHIAGFFFCFVFLINI